MAIRLLEEFGNFSPNQDQIDLLERVLSSVTVDRRLFFENSLSKKEQTCLYWAARGMTSAETASLMKVAVSTVETHRNRVKDKLQCKNMTQAVFEGLRYGLVGGEVCS